MGASKYLLAVFAGLLLAACGGGGGGGGGSPPPSSPPPALLEPQSIAFSEPCIIERQLEEGDFTNTASGGEGTGAITYVSSNTSVLEVNATSGEVTVVAPGEAVVTATKAADGAFASATADCIVHIQPPDAGVPFTATINESGANVSFPAWARGLDFLRTTQADCDMTQFASCADNQLSSITETERTIVGTTATTTRTAIWRLRRGSTVGAPLQLGHTKFSARAGAAMASFHDQLWLIGGHDTNPGFTAGVWRSSDGVFWTPANLNVEFPERADAQLLAYDDRLWLIGGYEEENGTKIWHDDVWSSEDGLTWQLETAAAAFGGRYAHAAVVFDDRMWVIGGSTSAASAGEDDVWWSTNGIEWTIANANAPFGPRSGHTVSALNGRLLLVAGSNGERLNDVWSSADGITWVQDSPSAAFSPRASHAAGAVDDRLVIVGGTRDEQTFSNEIWWTRDGVAWESWGEADFTPRARMGSAVHDGRFYIAGGEYATAEPFTHGGTEFFYADDVWSLRQPFFEPHTPYGPFLPGAPAAVVALGDRLYSIGLFDGARHSMSVLATTDGLDWEAPPSGASHGPAARVGGGYTAFDGRLWIVAGTAKTPFGDPVQRDVWHSADGGTWTQATNEADFGPRTGHALAAFNERLYLIGGHDGTDFLNDVWTSLDGETWTQITPAADFSPRADAMAAVFNGALWIIGGRGPAALNEAWSSTDGVSWQLRSTNVPLLPREGSAVAVHDDRLWIMGGRYYEPFFLGYSYTHELWSTADGLDWTQALSPLRRFSPRSHSGFASHAGKLWVIGGFDQFAPRNDVWSSVDGYDWHVAVSGKLPYPYIPPVAD